MLITTCEFMQKYMKTKKEKEKPNLQSANKQHKLGCVLLYYFRTEFMYYKIREGGIKETI